MKDKTFFGVTVSSCARRNLDLQKITRCLIENGWKQASSLIEAEYVLIMMCLSTEANIQISIKLLNQASEKLIVVGGCIHPRVEEMIDDLPNIVLKFFPKEGFGPLDEIFSLNPSVNEMPDVEDANNEEILYLRIQGGCTGSCSYCIARESIGRIKSKPLQRCLDEVDQRLTEQMLIIALSGDDVGSYGQDIGTDIGVLMTRIWEIARGTRFRIENINIKHLIEFKETFIRLARSSAIEHLQVPIQHTNQRILMLMKRFGEREKMLNALLQVSEKNTVRMETHFIVGFPTETLEELQESSIFCLEKLPFGKVGFFPYMDNPEASSYKLAPKISELELANRMQWLAEIGEKYGKVDIRKLDGKSLVEVRVTMEGY